MARRKRLGPGRRGFADPSRPRARSAPPVSRVLESFAMATIDKRGDKRRERLEAALRANLRKRKEQSKARERASGARDPAPAEAPQAEPTD